MQQNHDFRLSQLPEHLLKLIDILPYHDHARIENDVREGILSLSDITPEWVVQRARDTAAISQFLNDEEAIRIAEERFKKGAQKRREARRAKDDLMRQEALRSFEKHKERLKGEELFEQIRNDLRPMFGKRVNRWSKIDSIKKFIGVRSR